ncbi:MAG TPA: shikimate kinase [Candidatus Nitrosotalea sp.]|nr:shikimate kinase [Candidatus Nitrosotalea sp.]
MKRHVALVGFMASGKSTIGRKLARKLGRPFVDTDALVVRERGPISAIFASEGEPVFRGYESDAIRTALANPLPSVIALGGGALTEPANVPLLAESAYRVFIKASPEQILSRVRVSREIRPLLGSAPTLAGIKELYQRRLPQYEAADLTVDVSRRSDANAVDEIVEWLRSRQ